MSLYKVHEWWSSASAAHDSSADLCWSDGSLAVDRLGPHMDADCLVLANNTTLCIFKPNGDYTPQHLLLEMQLHQTILQVNTGKFISGAQDTQLIVLHPNSYAVYALQIKEGLTDIGDQTMLIPILNQTFTNKAYNMVHGNFGNTRSRELVCVQSLEGVLSFFDQEMALFTCSLTDILVPGPFAYMRSCDSFVIHKTRWILEIYSYQQMIEFGNRGQNASKKLVPQWIYNPGEEIFSLQVIQTSNNFSSIVALGERHLYCLQDNGLVKFMKKFDFMPICFRAYLIGWYYEPNCRLLVMVASGDSKLMIYENTTLLWSCELLFTPVAITPASLKGLPGALVTLSEDGVISCCYLGTEPDLMGNLATLQNNISSDPQTVEKELAEVEAKLKEILENEDIEDTALDEMMKMSIEVKECVQNLNNDTQIETLHLLMCPISVTLLFHHPQGIENVNVSYVCSPPYAFSENVQYLNKVSKTETLETNVFVSSRVAISEIYAMVIVTVTDEFGRVRAMFNKVLLPMKLSFTPSKPLEEYNFTLTINSSFDGEEDLIKVFSEYSSKQPLVEGNDESTMTFRSHPTNSLVTVTTNKHNFSIQAQHHSDITPVLDYFIVNFKNYHNKEMKRNITLSLNGGFSMDLLQSFMKCIESHAAERTKLENFQDQLNVLHDQFTLIQKRLLVQYGSLPPGDCDHLEFLLKDTHKRISTTTQCLIDSRENVFRAGSTLISVGKLTVMSFELMNADKEKIELLNDALTLKCFYDDMQNWEEIASQSVSYVLSTISGKTEKDREKLAPVAEQEILNAVNLKRFMKHIKLLFERLFPEFRPEHKLKNSEQKRSSESGPQRVEELVEVL